MAQPAAAVAPCGDGIFDEFASPPACVYIERTDTFTVPENVTHVTLAMRGGSGAGYNNNNPPGTRFRTTFAVTPGQVLQVNAAGDAPGRAGGYNGGGEGGDGCVTGGGGGGASDVRVAPFGLADRIAVAAGGGGDKGHNIYHDGRGGQGDFSGSPPETGGGHGTTSSGGSGGSSDFSGGQGGTLGSGGRGGGYDPHCRTPLVYGGGGGGGGLYGGGGGGAGTDSAPGAGGGGGGASYVDPSATETRFGEFGDGFGNVRVTWASADLAITQSFPAQAFLGRSYTYRLTVQNHGPDPVIARQRFPWDPPAGISVFDRLARSVDYVSASPSQGTCAFSSFARSEPPEPPFGGAQLTCSLEGLPAGGVATIDVTVTPRQPGTVTQRAIVQSAWRDATPANNTASNSFVVSRPPIAVATGPAGKVRATQPVTFDGAGSSGPDSPIATYEWTFSDGQSRATSAPQLTHAFATAGPATASLVVVDELGVRSTPSLVDVDVIDGTAPLVTITRPRRDARINLFTTEVRTIVDDGRKRMVDTIKRSGLRYTLQGTASDASGVKDVQLALKRLSPVKSTPAAPSPTRTQSSACRWLGRAGGLIKQRCDQPVWISAKLSPDGTWSYRPASNINVPSGLYTLSVQGTDKTDLTGNSATATLKLTLQLPKPTRKR